MENASKALIIAGAILLSIVLITLGVLIIGRGQDAIDSTNIDDQVLSTWNQKFTQYEGNGVNGSTVNTLLNSIISSNSIANSNGEKEKVITLSSSVITQNTSDCYDCIKTNGQPATTGLKNITKWAVNTKKYNVKFDYNPKGYVAVVSISASTT
ncbi:MAG: hypothetical protein IJJ82_01045 [Clostridia bacterium]|nr:hypothetical protein [Clostridia bacterium]